MSLYNSLHKGFEENRTQDGDDFQDYVVQSLKDIGFLAFLSSTEQKYPKMNKLIKNSADIGSLFMRFFPDIIALAGKPYAMLFVEAKASMNLEKRAWEQYLYFASMGLNLALVVGESDNGVSNILGWNFIENIKLRRGEETVSQYPEDKRFPVKDGWIQPRGSKRFTNLQSKGNYNISGSAYREIIDTSLLPWELFTRIVVARFERTKTII